MAIVYLTEKGKDYKGVCDLYCFTNYPFDFTGKVIKDDKLIKSGAIIMYGKFVNNVLEDKWLCLSKEELEDNFQIYNPPSYLCGSDYNRFLHKHTIVS